MGLHVVLPGGHCGGGPPSALITVGVTNVPSSTIAVLRIHSSLFTVHLLCEGFAP